MFETTQTAAYLAALFLTTLLQSIGCAEPPANSPAQGSKGPVPGREVITTAPHSDGLQANPDHPTSLESKPADARQPDRAWFPLMVQEEYASSALSSAARAYDWRFGRMPVTFADLETGPYLLFRVAGAHGEPLSYSELPSLRDDAPAHSVGVCFEGDYLSIDIGAGLLGRPESRGVTTEMTPAMRSELSAYWTADIYRMQQLRSQLMGLIHEYAKITGSLPATWSEVEQLFGLCFIEHETPPGGSAMRFEIDLDPEAQGYRIRISGLGQVEDLMYFFPFADPQDRSKPRLVTPEKFTGTFTPQAPPFGIFTIPKVAP